MAIGDDFSIATNGDIRYTGSSTNYTVIALHRWLGDLMDNAASSGNDLVDITDATASERSTDNIITLNAPYNIDDTAAQHLYDGSVIQASGGTIYDGILVFAAAGTYLQVLQNGAPAYPNFWTTALNADSANGISHRFMLKVRSGGTDIDGRRLIGQTREFGFTYSEFKINGTSRGNNVMALTYASDLNNQTAIATVKGWTTIVNATEGYKALDVDNDGTNEAYYSEWDRASFTINQFYERTKWLSRRSTLEDSNAETGNDFQVGNATIIGQAQSFSNGVVAQNLTRVRVRMKKFGSPTGNLVAKVYAHSGTFGTSSIPTGPVLATSVNFDIAQLTTAYLEYEIVFLTQLLMEASTNYTISFERAVIDGSNYVHIEGDTTGTHAGNSSSLVGATWTAAAAEDLWFQVFASPKLYGISGEILRGITHEVVIDGHSATALSAFEALSWSGGTAQLLARGPYTGDLTIDVVAASGTFTRSSGSFITDGFVPGQTIVTSGFTNGGNNTSKVISTVTALVITVTSVTGLVNESGNANENIKTGHIWIQLLTGVAPTDNQVITGGTSTGTVTMNVTITERSLSFPFNGQSTGSAIIGGYGVGIQTADLTASDKLFDLTNTQRTPPNNVTFTVSGLVSGEDRVLVTALGYSIDYVTEVGGPFTDGETLTFSNGATAKLLILTDNGTTGTLIVRLLTGSVPVNTNTITGGTSGATAVVNGSPVATIDAEQLSLNGALSGAAVIAVIVTEAIPTDTPSTGNIRILRANGVNSTHPYTAINYGTKTFTITSHDFSTNNAANGAGVFISYIDKGAASTSESFTGVYSADRSLFVRVRDGGGTPIKTFETTGTLGSAGGSSTAIRTSDL